MRTAIYKIVNTVNDKLYIGITDNPDRRWADHIRYSAYKKNKLYNAVRKYGIASFRMEVLHWCETRDDAYELEQFVVDVAGTRDYGYNTTPGGRGLGAGEQHPHYGKKRPAHVTEAIRKANTGRVRPDHEKARISETLRKIRAENPMPPMSEETRRKIGQAGIGREVAPETRAKISAGLAGFKRPPMSDETKAKLSAANKGRKHSPEVVEIIKAASTGRKYPNRKPQSAESRAKANESIRKTAAKKAKKVLCVETGEIFPNAKLAAEGCGVSASLVSMHCRGKMNGGKSVKGFTFRYAEENK